MRRIGIVGGGASGIVAAIEAANNGANVVVFEKKDRIGKKILVTGNGRCNFSNLNMSKDFYYTDDDSFVEKVLNSFGNEELISYFTAMGLLIRDKNKYLYPACEQASAVLDLLRCELKEKNVEIITDAEVVSISKKEDEFVVKTADNSKYYFDFCILATGGMAGLSKNEKCNGYDLAKKMGHSVSKLYPSLTQINCEGLNFKSVSGVKSECILYVFGNEELQMSQSGEVLFTDSGISGIVSFQVSHLVAECLDAGIDIDIVLDLLPGFTKENIESFITSKILLHSDLTLEEFFVGFLNKKLNIEIIKLSGLKPSMKVCNVDKQAIINAVLLMKELPVRAISVNGFDKAQVTGGGIPTNEVDCSFASQKCNGLYITGELINVDGVCGGYNLQWAFSSGIIAGRAASKRD